jgi:hypothetical protein
VLAEAHPAGFGEDELGDLEATVEGVREWLAEWPVPFASRTAALEFFESLFGEALAAQAWREGLEERDGGLWPQFEINVMARTLREAICRSYWHEWEQLRCPVLVVGAGAQEATSSQ